jgi:dihydroceramidase
MAFYGIVGLVLAISHKGEMRGNVAHISVILIGLGSAYFHGTLLYVGQMWDEIPMVWTVLCWIYILWQMDTPYEEGSMLFAIMLATYGVVWAYIHYLGAYTTAFQIHFGILTTIATLRMFWFRSKLTSRVENRMPIYFVIGFAVSFTCWLIDQLYCPQLHELPFNPQLHAIWHVLNACNIHHGVQYTGYLRMTRLGQDPKKVSVANLSFFYPSKSHNKSRRDF